MTDDLLAEQIAFYRADTKAYEAWWHDVFERGGGGAHGAASRRDRQAVLAELDRLAPLGPTLELASGTGSYTVALVERAEHLTAIDASPELLAILRAELRDRADRVTVVEADLFRWRPTWRYTTVFCAYWLSHVPSARFEGFWRLVADAVAPGGRAFVERELSRARRPRRRDEPPCPRWPCVSGGQGGTARSRTRVAPRRAGLAGSRRRGRGLILGQREDDVSAPRRTPR